MDVSEIPDVVAKFESDFGAAGTAERAEHDKRYLKSDFIFLGVTVPELRKIVKRFCRANKDLPADVLVALSEELWSEPVYERRAVAVELLIHYIQLLGPEELPLGERFLRESKTWALIDFLAAYSATLFGRYPELAPELERWATDDDFWIRRSALLVHLKPLGAGAGDFDRFTRFADGMLEEKEFFIRKAIGWILRETSKKRPELVYGWLASRTHRASGVTMREATKYLPDDKADELMTAYKEHRSAR